MQLKKNSRFSVFVCRAAQYGQNFVIIHQYGYKIIIIIIIIIKVVCKDGSNVYKLISTQSNRKSQTFFSRSLSMFRKQPSHQNKLNSNRPTALVYKNSEENIPSSETWKLMDSLGTGQFSFGLHEEEQRKCQAIVMPL